MYNAKLTVIKSPSINLDKSIYETFSRIQINRNVKQRTANTLNKKQKTKKISLEFCTGAPIVFQMKFDLQKILISLKKKS